MSCDAGRLRLFSHGRITRRPPDDPVAIVESRQVVGVKAVAEVGAEPDWPGCGRRADTLPDGRIAVGVFPGRLDALLEFVDAHVFRLEDHVLRVVQLPVLREDAPFGVEPLVERRIREWRYHGEPWQVDLRLHGEFGGLEEDVGAIVVQTEDEAPLQCDSVLVQPIHNRRITIGRVEALAIALQVCRRKRLESHEQTTASTLLRQLEQLLVIGQQDGRESVPPELQWYERLEEFDRVGAVGDEVEVDEDQFPCSVLADVGDDFVNRFLKGPTTPRRWYDAEFARMHATTRRFEDVVGEKVLARQQIATRKWPPGETESWRLRVARLE